MSGPSPSAAAAAGARRSVVLDIVAWSGYGDVLWGGQGGSSSRFQWKITDFNQDGVPDLLLRLLRYFPPLSPCWTGGPIGARGCAND